MVSKDTDEMRHAIVRQKFLIKQGYSFELWDEDKMMKNANDWAHRKKIRYAMSERDKQIEWMNDLLVATHTNMSIGNGRAGNRFDVSDDEVDADDFDKHGGFLPQGKKGAHGGRPHGENRGN